MIRTRSAPVIDAMTGHPIPAEGAPRREGDPPRLVASAQKAVAELGWSQNYPSLTTMIEHAWTWHQRHPEGFGGESE